MHINRMVLTNFMSHDHCELDLANISACSIVGKNGSGKSTLIEALLWGLFGHAKVPNKDLVRSTHTVMSVEIDYTLNNHDYAITRKFNDGTITLSASVDGQNLGQGTSVLSAQLARDMGLARETLVQSLIVPQGQLDAFLKSPPSDRRDIIIGALGMDRLTKAGVRARDMLKDAQTELSSKQEALTNLQTQIGKLSTDEQLDHDIEIFTGKMREAQSSGQDAALKRERLLAQDEEARKRFDSLTTEVEQIRDKMTDAIKDFDTKIKTAETNIENADQKMNQLDAMRQMLMDLQIQLAEATRMTEEAKDLRAKIEHFNRDIDNRKDKLKVVGMATDTCPVCLRPLEPDKWQAIIGQMKEDLAKQVAAMDLTNRTLQDIPLRKDPTTLITRIDQTKESIVKTEALKQTKELMENQQATLLEQKKTILDHFEQRLQQATTQLEGIKMRISTEVEVLDGEIEKQKKLVSGFEEALNSWRAEKETRRRLEILYANEKQKVEYYRVNFPQIEFVAAALSPNGIPLMITDYYLPVIEEKAEELLQVMSDGQLHIKLDVVESGRKGIELLAGTDQLRPIRSLSGGEGTRVALAIRLAISQVLFELAGSHFDCLWVDEPEFLDPEGINQFIQAINNLRGFYSQIFVISHYDQIKFAFPSFISMEKQNDVSSVTIS